MAPREATVVGSVYEASASGEDATGTGADRFLPGPVKPPCSDAVFLRRAYLDVLGVLPTPEEVRAFLADGTTGKRRRLIERLLERPEYAEFWSMRWAERLRIKSEFPINLWPNAAQAYHRWVFAAVRDRMPHDRFVRELLTGSGSNFREPTVNFYRAVATRNPKGWAGAVALTLLGERAEKWPAGVWDGFAVCFSRVAMKATAEWKEEVVYHDALSPAPRGALMPDGTSVDLSNGQDPRTAVAEWMTTGAGAKRVARAMANRVWAWLMGTGIVEEVDDLGPHNPPANEALLEFLARQLIAMKWDVRSLAKLVLTSRAYGASSLPGTARPGVGAGTAGQVGEVGGYASYRVRPIEGEVVVDALCALTGTAEKYVSMVPEPFTVVPEGTRAVMLPDGSITSPVLELFGRPARDTGLESERQSMPTVDRRLYLLNSSRLHQKLESGGGLARVVGKTTGAEAVERLYVAILSRPPTADESAAALGYFRESESVRAGVVDLAWALINSTEFLHRH